MKTVTTVVLMLVVALSAKPAAQTGSIRADLMKDWANQKDKLMKIADAMPEDKFSFKSTPPQRDYGQQILHIAGSNVGLLKLLGATAPAPMVDQKATSKAVILKALGDSFDYGTAVLNEMTDARLLETVQGPRFLGDGTRARIVYQLIAHTEDIYGQMAVYLRLNGIVPPASRGI